MFDKVTWVKNMHFQQEAVHTPLHAEMSNVHSGDTCIVNTGDRALSPSDWQASGLVASSPGDKVRKRPRSAPGEKGEMTRLWENSVQDLPEFHRCTSSPGSARPRRLPHRNTCTIFQKFIFKTTHQSTEEIAENWKKH